MTDGSGTGNDGSTIVLVIAGLNLFVVWTKDLNWGWIKLQYDSIVRNEGMSDDENKLKTSVLKMGDN